MPIQDAYNKVPLMFRSQIRGRSQLHYPSTGDAARWVNEWTEKVYEKPVNWGDRPETRTYQFNWRLVTNGGQDDGMIRPVIGAFGLPFFPGSSMKGVFRRVCSPSQAERYCGNADQPGILRFLGGYPTEDYDWTDNLLDLVHPQQGWQVETNNTAQRPAGESAFALVSLFEPEFQFAISSTENLSTEEWTTVWELWEKAIASGLGCRVSAGYGMPQNANIPQEQLIGKFHLQGKGLASKNLNSEPEFRPNMFKSAIRGHALRIFGGLTTAENAKRIVEQLFGGVTGEGSVGLVKMSWQNRKLEFGNFDGGYDEDTYIVEGDLKWILTATLPDEQKKVLSNLIKLLTRFTMLLGGFGKSWRRADHSLFYEDYYDRRKPLIGCHWQYGAASRTRVNLIVAIPQLTEFLDKLIDNARKWLNLQNTALNPDGCNWREAWTPNKVQVWARIAEHDEDSEAIGWFHGPYRQQPQGTIYHTNLTGQINQISKIWHRMYPKFRLVRNPNDPKKPIVRSTEEYLEILVIFPDNSPEFTGFQGFLHSDLTDFQLVWGNLHN
jgi:CRISPR-associated protein Cmr6